jgi:hypothetical protein
VSLGREHPDGGYAIVKVIATVAFAERELEIRNISRDLQLIPLESVLI